MNEHQHTIKEPVSLSGIGLHTGQEVNLTFKPAPANTGYVFIRTDLDDNPQVKATVKNVKDVSRGTTIEANGITVNTVEHTLSALSGLQIDNIYIELDGPEPPVTDGSAIAFVEQLEQAGIKKQKAKRKYFELKENIRYKDEDSGAELLAIPSDQYRLTVMVDYDSRVLGTQHASIQHIDEFKEQIADARTFCFLHELEDLLDDNLIKGGDINNAIVVVDKVVKKNELQHLAKVFDQPDIEVKEEGILNNVELHHQNEPARHKLLDIVGDMALVNAPLKAHIIAFKPGHKANVAFAERVQRKLKDHTLQQSVPDYDPTQAPVCDISKIAELLPHRYPFLLVDKVISLSEERVVGVKNVTINEEYFQGHFPGDPIMPGVLQVEAMAQTGGVLVLNTVSEPKKYDTYFLKIDKTRFKQKVVPGDTLILELELTRPIRRGLVQMKGKAYVGDKVATEAELMAQIIKRDKK
jgi:UDP-3-O-[3-hydroxymyristoyl] N-acetylglucosamine deacetylase/3-hydroxyacyl-[acyl-carrier-protein] dehydratase